jgi:hypothetical protein
LRISHQAKDTSVIAAPAHPAHPRIRRAARRSLAAAALATAAWALTGAGPAGAVPLPTFWSSSSALSIGNLLLSPDRVTALTGADRPMAIVAMTPTMIDTAKRLSPASCAGAYSPTEKQAYDGSGYTDMTTQLIADGNSKNTDHTVTQGVVRFPTATQAASYVARAQQYWAACADSTVIHTSRAGSAQPWHLGALTSSSDGTLLVLSQQSVTGSRCERALTVAGPVVIDIAACGQKSDPTGQAAAIATTTAAAHPEGS